MGDGKLTEESGDKGEDEDDEDEDDEDDEDEDKETGRGRSGGNKGGIGGGSGEGKGDFESGAEEPRSHFLGEGEVRMPGRECAVLRGEGPERGGGRTAIGAGRPVFAAKK